jgi:hypothetical protein
MTVGSTRRGPRGRLVHPIATALLKAQVGGGVAMRTRRGTAELEIIAIRYDELPLAEQQKIRPWVRRSAEGDKHERELGEDLTPQ